MGLEIRRLSKNVISSLISPSLSSIGLDIDSSKTLCYLVPTFPQSHGISNSHGAFPLLTQPLLLIPWKIQNENKNKDDY